MDISFIMVVCGENTFGLLGNLSLTPRHNQARLDARLSGTLQGLVDSHTILSLMADSAHGIYSIINIDCHESYVFTKVQSSVETWLPELP